RQMRKKNRRARRGRGRSKAPGLLLLAVIALIVAGQPGPALDVLAQVGLDLRDVIPTSSISARDDRAPSKAEHVGAGTSGNDPHAYARNAYGGWIDESGNCHNTRAEILIASSTGPVHVRD